MQQSGLGFKRSLGVGTIPIWQRDKAFLLAQGGFVLVKTGFVPGDIIPGGSPLVFDEALRTATVVKTATLQANAASNAVNYRVKKGSALKVGDNFGAVNGGVSSAITGIDKTSSTDYDTVTVGTTLGVSLSAGQTVFTSASAGATSAALPNGVNGLLYEDAVVLDSIQQSVSAVIRGTAYARRVPYSADIDSLPGLNNIIYSQSY